MKSDHCRIPRNLSPRDKYKKASERNLSYYKSEILIEHSKTIYHSYTRTWSNSYSHLTVADTEVV